MVRKNGCFDDLLVVIPTYNEAKTVAQVVEGVLSVLGDCHILIVDDGSTDGTCEKVGELKEKYKGVEVICHKKNMGYGATLKDGFEYAIEKGFDRVVTLDADMQHPPSWIPKLLDALKVADVASGSRYLPNSPRFSEPPKTRRRINEIVTREINRQLGLSLTDAFCGYKAYRRKVLEALEITETGYAMPLQVWVQVARMGFKVVEVPVPLYYPDYSRFFGSGLDAPDVRLKYYLDVLEKELGRWRSRSSLSAHIQTTQR